MINAKTAEPKSPAKPPQKAPPQSVPKPPTNPLTQLSQQSLTKYLKNFITINDYRAIDQGKDLLKLLTIEVNMGVLEKAVKMMCCFIEHAEAEGKVCGLQFLKEMMDLGRVRIFSTVQKHIMGTFLDVVEYRSHVKSLIRGSSYFAALLDKNEKPNKVADLIRLSNTFFRMSHEMLYVWGVRYFPESHFTIVYNKLSKYCTFPTFPADFKFYRIAKIQQLEKSKGMQETNQFIKNRKSIQVPALSNRSKGNRRSGDVPLLSQLSSRGERTDRSQNKKENQDQIKNEVKNQDQIKNKVKVQDQKINNEVKEPQQEDIFESQRNQGSKIVQKGSKIVLKPAKSSQKIPRNIIYRQSSVQDPVDITIDVSQSTKQLKTKNSQKIEVPLGIIVEVTTQDGSSKVPSKNISRNQRSEKITVESVDPDLDFKKKTPEIIKEEEGQKQNISELSSQRVGYHADSIQSSSQMEKVQQSMEKETLSPKIIKTKQIQDIKDETELPVQSRLDQISQTEGKKIMAKGKKLFKNRTAQKKNIFSDQVKSDEIQIENAWIKNKQMSRLRVNHVLDIKQMGQATNIAEKIKGDLLIQVQMEKQRKIKSQRKLRKFKQISLTLIPDSTDVRDSKIDKLQSELSENYIQQVTNLRQEVNQRLANLERTTASKAEEHSNHINQILQQHMREMKEITPIKIKKSESNTKSDFKIQQKFSFSSKKFFNSSVNQNSGGNSIHGKTRSRSNNSKRSSLSQIRNLKQSLFEPGTMLFYLAKRKSVVL